MKRLLGLVLPIFLVGCDDIHIGFSHGLGSAGTKGDGKPKEESRTVAEFDKIVVGSAFQVEAKEGKLEPIKVSADSNLLTHIKSEVKDGTLRVWIDGSISTETPLKLTLSTPTIHKFEASGATNVNLALAAKHDLNLSGSGSSTLKVDGDIANLNCDLSGASRATLSTKSLAKLDANLTGSSGFVFSGTLDSITAELSGASTIKGNMNGKEAKVTMSGASNGVFGKFDKVSKNLTGASNASFDGSN